MLVLGAQFRNCDARLRQTIRIVMLAACAFLATWPASAQDKSKLGNVTIVSLFHAVDLSGASFQVVDSRFEETATAVVLFGIIGGLVNSGINGDEDHKKSLPYADAVAKLEPGRILNEKLGQTLAARAQPLAPSAKGASHSLSVEIKEWGLTRTSMRDERVTTFIRLHLVMKQGNKVVWDTYMKDSWGRAAMLSEMTNEMLVEDIESLAAKMGERIAYEIIYR